MKSEDIQYGLLILGFFTVTVAVLIAYTTPAETYELSIYRETPIGVWIGMALALTIGSSLSFKGRTSSVSLQALLLSSLSVLVIVTLPLIRGYYHVGEGDAMSHVGIVRELLAGTGRLTDIGYPAVHTIIVYVNSITNVSIPHSFHYITYVFMLVFLVFIPLLVRSIENRHRSTLVAVFVAFFFLPINLISVSMNVHPSTQALLFAPVLFYIYYNYINSSDHRYACVFIIGSLAIILLHPQQAVNVMLLIGVVAIVQFLSPTTIESLTEDRSVYIMPAIFFVLFWIWFQGRFTGTVRAQVATILISDTDAAGEVSQRGGSLAQIGTDLFELFAKLFGVSLVFCLLAGGLMVLILFRWLIRRDPRSDSMLLYLTIGFGPVIGMFFVYLVANIRTQSFRHLGFIMVIVTIFGAIALDRLTDWAFDKETAETVLIIVLLILFVPSMLIIHPSPYIFHDSGHVPKGQVDGFETAFDYQGEGIRFLHIRSQTFRYAHFTEGRNAEIPQSRMVPDHFANRNLPSHYNEPHYLAITSADRNRDPVLYQGFRYSQADFRYLETDSNISRVQDGGQFNLYLVEPKSRDTTAE